ncbi:ankyrin, partial [Amniculicola lignicola CBS 123094]
TPLKLAAKHGHESVLVLLLSSPDININSSSRSAFHFAMEFGHSSIARKILSIQPEVSINFKGDWPCQTLLHIACLKDHEEIVKFLLQREDIDVNVTDIGGSTPLHLAACNGHTKIVRRL